MNGMENSRNIRINKFSLSFCPQKRMIPMYRNMDEMMSITFCIKMDTCTIDSNCLISKKKKPKTAEELHSSHQPGPL
jgi:hypothetical protein